MLVMPRLRHYIFNISVRVLYTCVVKERAFMPWNCYSNCFERQCFINHVYTSNRPDVKISYS